MQESNPKPYNNTGNTLDATLPLVLPLDELDAGMLPLVGGKAANLGELLRVGLPVPSGFCVTTAAYRTISLQAGLEPMLSELANFEAGDLASLNSYASAARAAILGTPIPVAVSEAVQAAYSKLTQEDGRASAVAVRSSATAEDLPFASFAGQQDTYLNIVGGDAVLDAVKRCWASLWTDRAVSYRASGNIDQRTVRLAVVVQRMVDASAAGVLFTANPLTGKRRQAVIDANPGLGEAVVSGAVNPDHFVVNTLSGEIFERRLGDKRLAIRSLPSGGTEHVELASGTDTSSLTDEQIVALARLGAQVEEHFGRPQDIEWAIDGEGRIWLTQSRPITTLYPLPANAPTDDNKLRVYFSVNVAQGVFRPFTPMGIATLRLMFSAGGTLTGFPPPDPVGGPAFLVEAGHRLFFDMTSLLRTIVGPKLLSGVMSRMEARSRVVLEHLAADPRLKPIPTPRRVVVMRALKLLARIRVVPLYIVQALFNPKAARRRLCRLERRLRTLGTVSPDATAEERLDAFERLFLEETAPVILSPIPLVMFVFALPALLGKLLGDMATDDEQQAVLRSLPYNPTTEMDLALWKVAERVRSNQEVATLFQEISPEQLAAKYREGTLPPVLQQGLREFLRVYGHRGVAEIDLGLPRWSEDPSHILGVLGNYLQMKDPKLASDAQFRRGATEARAMAAELTRRARKRSRVRGALVGFSLNRMRNLSGLRELPKYDFVLLISRGRQLLIPVGQELVRTGSLEQPEDIFFLNTAEARQGLRSKDFRDVIGERRASYQQELGRRHIPRILLSDGTEPELAVLDKGTMGTGADNSLRGTPASAGVVTGRARVVLDPIGARLEPGEILVAPSTDPGWTPLFLTAGGLVMEMGGAMSHGAVVAREYGIPAVVGLPAATERIATGQRITVDGSNGTVFISD